MPETHCPEVNDISAYMEELYDLLQANMAAAQSMHMKHANAKRMHVQFALGDLVVLSTKHLNTNRPCKKLDFKFIGPFRVSQIVNPVAVRLELPDSMRIHNVFHVSMLEPYHIVEGTPVTVPEVVASHDSDYEVDAVLDVLPPTSRPRRRLKSGRPTNNKEWLWLVKWAGYDETTWEPASMFAAHPSLLLDFHKRNPQLKCPDDILQLVYAQS